MKTTRFSAVALLVGLWLAPMVAFAQPFVPGTQGSDKSLPAPISLPVPTQHGSDAGSAIGSGSAEAPKAADAHSTEATKHNPLFAIKVIAGLMVLLALAHLGGHRKVVRFQERLGISGVVTAGFPFVAMGAIASHPDVGILSADVVSRL